MIARICDTFRNSFDSIIISMNLGLVAITIYGNYYYIYSAVYGIMLVVSSAMGASIGNSIVGETKEKNYQDLEHYQFIYAWICSICTVCLVALYQPFMKIWVGTELMLSDKDMLLFCIYFYLINMCNVRNQYINGTGMWWQLKVNYVLEAFGNLALNIILGKFLGITGILLATIITIFVFNYVLRTHKLFIFYFERKGESKFNIEQAQYMLVTLISSVLVYFLCRRLALEGFEALIINGFIAIIFGAALYLIVFLRTGRFKYFKELVLKIKRIYIE